jgi:hypothetical protein
VSKKRGHWSRIVPRLSHLAWFMARTLCSPLVVFCLFSRVGLGTQAGFSIGASHSLKHYVGERDLS